MEKNRCIAIGCHCYYKTSKPRIKNGILDCTPRYMCNRHCMEIKDIASCDRIK